MKRRFNKIISLVISITFIFQQASFAQGLAELNLSGHFVNAGRLMTVDKFRPIHLRSLGYNPQSNNFRLFLDRGDLKKAPSTELESSTRKLLKYFLIGITLPNDSFWVNLRPDSPDNVIDDWLAQTDIGRVLLEADVQLKKDTAMATSPANPTGRIYWEKLYKKAAELLGSENVNIPTLVRPWIVPGDIIIRENSNTAYIYKATLKVMLEEDYLKGSAAYEFKDPRMKALNEYSSQLLREYVLPILNREVNSSKKYADLRQVYYSLVLAQWFKAKYYGQSGVYSWMIDRKNLGDLTSQDNWSKTTYFKEYQASFKNGEYNSQEPVRTAAGQSMRSYFSGGIKLGSSSPIAQNSNIIRGMTPAALISGLTSSPLKEIDVTGGTLEQPARVNISSPIDPVMPDIAATVTLVSSPLTDVQVSKIRDLSNNPDIMPITPAIQNYAWGGKTNIPTTLGLPNTEDKPVAEAWYGMHKNGPSATNVGGEKVTLLDINTVQTENATTTPDPIFGAKTPGTQYQLPFLLKLLDARTMLSIQAHPNKAKAEAGFARDEALSQAGKITKENRTFVDNNHKPEVHVAQTDFWMLHGFRPEQEIIDVFNSIPEFRNSRILGPILNRFEAALGQAVTDTDKEAALRGFYKETMELDQVSVDRVLEPLVARLDATKGFDRESPDYWVQRAAHEPSVKPADGQYSRGIFSIYMLNLLHLEPHQGTYQEAGVLHAYLEGFTVEDMANSDNVLRGGLTPKFVDIPGLLDNVTFRGGKPAILNGEKISDTETVYRTQAREFELSRIELSRGSAYRSLSGRMNADILVVLDGQIEVALAGGKTHTFVKGESFLVPFVNSTSNTYEMTARGDRATVYKSSVPVASSSPVDHKLSRPQIESAIHFQLQGRVAQPLDNSRDEYEQLLSRRAESIRPVLARDPTGTAWQKIVNVIAVGNRVELTNQLRDGIVDILRRVNVSGGFELYEEKLAVLLKLGIGEELANHLLWFTAAGVPSYLDDVHALKYGTSGLRDFVKWMTDIETYINTLATVDEIEHLRQTQPTQPIKTTSLQKALGITAEKVFGLKNEKLIALAGDFRTSTPRLTRAVAAALRARGYTVINCGFVPTEALAFFARKLGIAAIMVTGSHIPDDQNGIKYYFSPGIEVLKFDEARLLARVKSIRKQIYGDADDTYARLFDRQGHFRSSPEVSEPLRQDEAVAAFSGRFIKVIPNRPLENLGRKVTVWGQSAVGAQLLADLLPRLGADSQLVDYHPDRFLSIDTENVTPDDLDYVQRLMDEQGTDILVSLDGDSDRPFVFVRGKDGKVQFIRGDILNLAAAKFLDLDAIVTPVSASKAVKQVIEAWNVERAKEGKRKIAYLHVDIGSPYVIAGMRMLARWFGYKRIGGWEVNGGFLLWSLIKNFRNSGYDLDPSLATRDAYMPIVATLTMIAESGKAPYQFFEGLIASPYKTQAGLLDKFPITVSKSIVSKIWLQKKGKNRSDVRDIVFLPGNGNAEIRYKVTAWQVLKQLVKDVRLPGEERYQRALDLLLNGRSVEVDAADPLAREAQAIRDYLSRFFTAEQGFSEIASINYTSSGPQIHFANGEVAHIRASGNSPQLRAYSMAMSQERADGIVVYMLSSMYPEMQAEIQVGSSPLSANIASSPVLEEDEAGAASVNFRSPVSSSPTALPLDFTRGLDGIVAGQTAGGYDVVTPVMINHNEIGLVERRHQDTAGKGILKPDTTFVPATDADWHGKLGNGMGTVAALEAMDAELTRQGTPLTGILRQGKSVLMLHTAGDATRIALARTHNNKPLIVLANGITIMEGVMRQSQGMAVPGKVFVNWGDQLIFPAVANLQEKIARLSGQYEVLLFGIDFPAEQFTEQDAKSFGWQIIANDQVVMAFDDTRDYGLIKSRIADLESQGYKVTIRWNMGSFAFGPNFVEALRQVFGPEIAQQSGAFNSDEIWQAWVAKNEDSYVTELAKSDAKKIGHARYMWQKSSELKDILVKKLGADHLIGSCGLGLKGEAMQFDFGTNSSYVKTLGLVTTDTAEGRVLREFFGLEKKTQTSGSLALEDAVLDAGAQIDGGSAVNSLVAESQIREAHISDSRVQHSFIGSLSGNNITVFNVVEPGALSLPDNTMAFDVFHPTRGKLRFFFSVGLESGSKAQWWDAVLPGNPMSLHELSDLMKDVPVDEINRAKAEAIKEAGFSVSSPVAGLAVSQHNDMAVLFNSIIPRLSQLLTGDNRVNAARAVFMTEGSEGLVDYLARTTGNSKEQIMRLIGGETMPGNDGAVSDAQLIGYFLQTVDGSGSVFDRERQAAIVWQMAQRASARDAADAALTIDISGTAYTESQLIGQLSNAMDQDASLRIDDSRFLQMRQRAILSALEQLAAKRQRTPAAADGRMSSSPVSLASSIMSLREFISLDPQERNRLAENDPGVIIRMYVLLDRQTSIPPERLGFVFREIDPTHIASLAQQGNFLDQAYQALSLLALANNAEAIRRLDRIDKMVVASSAIQTLEAAVDAAVAYLYDYTVRQWPQASGEDLRSEIKRFLADKTATDLRFSLAMGRSAADQQIWIAVSYLDPVGTVYQDGPLDLTTMPDQLETLLLNVQQAQGAVKLPLTDKEALGIRSMAVTKGLLGTVIHSWIGPSGTGSIYTGEPVKIDERYVVRRIGAALEFGSTRGSTWGQIGETAEHQEVFLGTAMKHTVAGRQVTLTFTKGRDGQVIGTVVADVEASSPLMIANIAANTIRWDKRFVGDLRTGWKGALQLITSRVPGTLTKAINGTPVNGSSQLVLTNVPVGELSGRYYFVDLTLQKEASGQFASDAVARVTWRDSALGTVNPVATVSVNLTGTMAGSAAVSSPVIGDKIGGIDFRAMPIMAQQFSGLSMLKAPAKLLSPAELETVRMQIAKMVEAGIKPTTERILEYASSCCLRSDSSRDVTKVLACIADVLRLEEERAEYTDTTLRQLLVALESEVEAGVGEE